jgi:hypothetical protein
MQISGEIRWFWKSTAPAGLDEWFRSGGEQWCAAGGGRIRTDQYLRDPRQVELGVKLRGGKKGVEVKGLIAERAGALAAAPFEGSVQIWAKWTSEALELGPGELIALDKQRWLRKFDTGGSAPCEIPLDASETPTDGRALPRRGCNVELTRIALRNGDTWWTLGLEAFGAVEMVERDVCIVAGVLAGRRPPPLGAGEVASYPMWLGRHVLPAT